MSTRDAAVRDGAFIRFVRPPPSFIPFSVLLEWSAVAVGTVKKERGGETLICQWVEEQYSRKRRRLRALQLQQHRRRPTCSAETMMKMYSIDL